MLRWRQSICLVLILKPTSSMNDAIRLFDVFESNDSRSILIDGSVGKMFV